MRTHPDRGRRQGFPTAGHLGLYSGHAPTEPPGKIEQRLPASGHGPGRGCRTRPSCLIGPLTWRAPDGIRLIDVVYNVKISDDSVAVLIPPQSAIVHSSHDLAGNDPILAGEKPAKMFVRFDVSTTLDPGATSPSLTIDVHCKDQGEANLTCHVHADIDQSELFPTSRNRDDKQALTVV